jgi:hypothetical protein
MRRVTRGPKRPIEKGILKSVSEYHSPSAPTRAQRKNDSRLKGRTAEQVYADNSLEWRIR